MGGFARLARNQFTRLERNVHLAGQRKTRHAIALLQSVFASPQHSCQQRVRVLRCVPNARTPSVNAMRVGQGKASMRHGIILVSVSQNWVFAKLVKSQSTLLAKNAHLAGLKRTRRACALQQSDFVTRM